MNPFATPVRYFRFEASLPVDFSEGSVTVGGAVHAETNERLTALRVFGERELVSELWLTADETVELATRLLGMGSWFYPDETETRNPQDGEAE